MKRRTKKGVSRWVPTPGCVHCDLVKATDAYYRTAPAKRTTCVKQQNPLGWTDPNARNDVYFEVDLSRQRPKKQTALAYGSGSRFLITNPARLPDKRKRRSA